jgi:hypothetical protein
LADNQLIDNGSETDFTAVADEITSPYTGGSAKAQGVKLLSGTANSNEVIGGDATNGLDVDVTRVSGTVTVGDGGSTLSVDDGAGSLTVDAPLATPVNVQIGDGSNTATVRNLASNDALNVSIVDGSGSQVTSFGGSGGTSMTDDAAFTPGSGSITPAGAMFDDSTPDSVNEGDAGVVRMSANRNLYTTIRDAAGNERGLNIDSSGHIGVSAAPAAARTTDSVAVSHQTDAVMQGLTARTPVFAAIDAASSGDNTLVAAQGSGNKIRVYSIFLLSAGAVNVRFESGASGTALTGQMNLAANGGFVLPFNPLGWFETAANTLLNLELSGATSVDGCLTYSIVT